MMQIGIAWNSPIVDSTPIVYEKWKSFTKKEALREKKNPNINPISPYKFPKRPWGYISWQTQALSRGRKIPPSKFRKGLKLYVVVTCRVLVTENTKATQYKAQNIWQFTSAIPSYFPMIKFALKRILTAEDKFKDQNRNVYTYDRVLEPDFHSYVLSCFVPLKIFLLFF